MAHHSSEIPQSIMDMFPDREERNLQNELNKLREQFGATNKFPQGKLNEADEGEIAFGIATDKTSSKVIISFGKPIAWIGMDKSQALGLAETIIKKQTKSNDAVLADGGKGGGE